MRFLITVVAATAFLTLAACGGSDASRITPPSPTLCGTAIPVTIPYTAGGNFSIKDPSFSQRPVCIGQHITVTLTGWKDTDDVTMLLLTQEQVDDLRNALFNGGNAKLGTVRTKSGAGTFDFILSSSYKTVAGETEPLESGQRLHAYAFQFDSLTRGSEAMGGGPLVVR